MPLGLILVIGPGNYPLLLTMVPALQAIAAGNVVWIKPAPGCTGLFGQIHELFLEAGFAPDVLTVLPESVEVARAAIAARPDKVVFTGSAETGRRVLAQLAPQLTPATMELSGCDAVFIRSDADLDLAARALAFGITLNRGATCIAPRRVFVPVRHAIALTQKLTAELNRRATIPISPSQAPWLPNLRAALGDGARLIHGNVLSDPLMGPLVVTDARPEMRLLREGTFAPVMSLVPVTSDGAALIANACCPYALSASVFSKDVSAARALADRIRAGSVIINDVIVPTADPRLPFGGVGDSGFGVTRGAEGLLEMTVLKVIAMNAGHRRRHFEPVDSRDYPLFKALLELTNGRSFTTKLRAIGKILGESCDRRTRPRQTDHLVNS